MPISARRRSNSRLRCLPKSSATACDSCAGSSASSTCIGGPAGCSSTPQSCDSAGDFVPSKSPPAMVDRRDPARRGIRPPPPLSLRCALFLDIDGTLVEFAPTPEHLKVDPDLVVLLPTLAFALDGALALITGRAIRDVERLFP